MDYTMMINLLSRAAVLLLLLPVHEYAHARVSYALGDPTAADAGRLDLNPLVHLDPVGSLLMLLVGVGWAKPVPVDPRYYKNPRRDMVITAMAGPLANLLMGFLFLILAQISMGYWIRGYYNGADVDTLYYMVLILQTIASISVSLAVFNLLPVPPLDGSRLVALADDLLPLCQSHQQHLPGAAALYRSVHQHHRLLYRASSGWHVCDYGLYSGIDHVGGGYGETFLPGR